MYDELLKFAVQLAKAAGGIQLAYFRGDRLSIETKSNVYDVVTRADRESEELIAGMIAERYPDHAILGSVSVVSSLTHGNVALAEVMVPRMRHFSNEDGVLINEVLLPDNAIIAAVASGGDVEVANDETVLHPGDKAIVVADEDVLDDVRLAFRGL